MDPENPRRPIGIWLLMLCAMVFLMVILGGLTRLTGSGLSMVEWNPIFGILPPLDHAEWERVFALYRESPEYRLVNPGMDLAGFQAIYWLEYFHRLFGRLIGAAFLVPFLVFLRRGMLRRDDLPRLLGMFLLGGLQGLIGWYMVKSGLVDNPHVSQYRLALHLLTGVLIYGYIYWTALHYLRGRATASPAPGAWPFRLAVALVFLTMGAGALVAGLKAGHAFNTFPKMAGEWVPDFLFPRSPWWINLFEDHATVQFQHRVLGLVTGLVLLSTAVLRYRLAGTHMRPWLAALGVMAIVQPSLGIATLVLQVPIALASLHQAGALVLMTLVLHLLHLTRHPHPVGGVQAHDPGGTLATGAPRHGEAA